MGEPHEGGFKMAKLDFIPICSGNRIDPAYYPGKLRETTYRKETKFMRTIGKYRFT
jgi:hypothetical protein